MRDPCDHGGSSFREVLESLINETVRVEPTGAATTINGKLISVHSSYIAIAVNEHHDQHGDRGDDPRHQEGSVRLAWVPVDRISVISEC